MRALGLFDNQGLLFGLHGRTGEFFTYNGNGHAMIVAPSRAGKGVGFVIPNLVSYPGSMIVIDPKGENAAQTARHRSEGFGHEVFVLDPSGVSGVASSSYNPLSWLEASTENDLMADVIEFSQAIVENGFGKDTYWSECARNLFRALVLFLFGHDPNKLNLNELYRLTRLPLDEFTQLFEMLKRSACPVPVVRDWIREAGAWYLGQHLDHQKYHLGTLQIATAWMGNKGAQQIMGKSDFSMRDLKREGMTVYLCVHPLQLNAYRGWFRLLVSQAVKGVFEPIGQPRVSTPAGKIIHPRVVFMLDEYARAVGRLNAIDNAIPQILGYGGQFAFILQSIGQAKDLYQEGWSTFEEGCGLQCYMQSRGETAEHLSNRLGLKTQSVHNAGGFSQTSRPLMFPDEVSNLPKDDLLCFVEGSYPFCGKRITSYRDEWCRKHLDPSNMDRLALLASNSPTLFDQVRSSLAANETMNEAVGHQPPRVTDKQREEIARFGGADW